MKTTHLFLSILIFSVIAAVSKKPSIKAGAAIFAAVVALLAAFGVLG